MLSRASRPARSPHIEAAALPGLPIPRCVIRLSTAGVAGGAAVGAAPTAGRLRERHKRSGPSRSRVWVILWNALPTVSQRGGSVFHDHSCGCTQAVRLRRKHLLDARRGRSEIAGRGCQRQIGELAGTRWQSCRERLVSVRTKERAYASRPRREGAPARSRAKAARAWRGTVQGLRRRDS